MTCPFCGAQISDTARFCTECGNSIEQPTVAAVPAPAAPPQPQYQPQPQPQPEPQYQPQPQYQQPQYQQPQYQQAPPQPQYQQQPQPQQYQQPQYQPQPQPQYQQPQYQQPQPGQPPVPPQPGQKPEKKKGKLGLIIGIIAAAVVVLGVVAFFIFGRADTYDLGNYLTVEYDGINGKATAFVDVDWDKLAREIGTKRKLDLKFLDRDEMPGSEWDKIVDAFETINVRAKNDENLSNGDVIDVTISYDNKVASKAKLKFKGDACQFTVSGLPEYEPVDPFEGLEVSFSGSSGDGYCDITYNGPCDSIYSIDFDASEYFGLSNGDQITVTFNDDGTLEMNDTSQRASRPPTWSRALPSRSGSSPRWMRTSWRE